MFQIFIVLFGLFLGATAESRLDYLDMVFVIDDSTRLREFRWDEDRVVLQSIDKLVNRVFGTVHSPRVGLVTYNDKPYLPGMSSSRLKGNYCSRLQHALGAEPKYFTEKLRNLDFPGQGADYWYETDSYAGLMKALDPRMKWRESTPERPVTHLIVLLAGANPRRAGHSLQDDQIALPMISNNGDFEYVCWYEDYYTRDQVFRALKERNILLYVISWPVYYQPYEDLISSLGRGRIYSLLSDYEKIANQLIYYDGKQETRYPALKDLPPDEYTDVEGHDDNFPEEIPVMPDKHIGRERKWYNYLGIFF